MPEFQRVPDSVACPRLLTLHPALRPALGIVYDNNYANSYDAELDYTCSGSGVLAGIYSVHSDNKEDRSVPTTTSSSPE